MTKPTPRAVGTPSEANTGRDAGQTKQRLSGTVSDLAAKTNLPPSTQHKAAETAEAVQNKAQEGLAQAKTAADQALAKVPLPVRSRIENVVATIRRRPGPSIAVAVTVFMVLRKMRSRR